MATPTGAFVHTPQEQSLWIHFRTDAQPVYWGTAVTAPEFEEMPKYLEVYNDLAGRSEPYQLIYDGCSSLVSVTTNRLDLEVTRTLRDHAQRAGAFQTGSDGYYARGSAVLGRTDFAVITTNKSFGTANATAGLNAGRKYVACTVMGYKESAAGTRAMEVAIVFRAWSIWLGVGAGFQCFTEFPTAFGTLTLG